MHNRLGHLDQVPQMNLAAALKIIAANAVNNACNDWIEDGWEQIPDIGEMDYERVVGAIRVASPVRPTTKEHESAMKFLMDRVDNSEM